MASSGFMIVLEPTGRAGPACRLRAAIVVSSGENPAIMRVLVAGAPPSAAPGVGRIVCAKPRIGHAGIHSCRIRPAFRDGALDLVGRRGGTPDEATG
jgi:hypothetical protein